MPTRAGPVRSTRSRPSASTTSGASSPSSARSSVVRPNFCSTSSRTLPQRFLSLAGAASVSQTSSSESAQAPMKLSRVRSSPKRSLGAWLSCAKKVRQSSAKSSGLRAAAASQPQSSCSSALHCSKPSKFCPRRKATYASWSSPRMPSSSPPYSRVIISSSCSLRSMWSRVVSAGVPPRPLRARGTTEKKRLPLALLDSSWGSAAGGACPCGCALRRAFGPAACCCCCGSTSISASSPSWPSSGPSRPSWASCAACWASAGSLGPLASYSARLERTARETGSILPTRPAVAWRVSSAHCEASCRG
mmetsp:Transcript_65594/g.211613  ORF Transcript_65594/g.211613 Transcript_65594/m.211613 type:complete len:305 (+) Transcript_65594:69-983(+)